MLSSGTSMFPEIVERITNELTALVPYEIDSAGLEGLDGMKVDTSSLKWIASSSPMVRVGFRPTAESESRHWPTVLRDAVFLHGPGASATSSLLAPSASVTRVLFQPSFTGTQDSGIHDTSFRSATWTSAKSRTLINVVLSSGTTMFQQFF